MIHNKSYGNWILLPRKWNRCMEWNAARVFKYLALSKAITLWSCIYRDIFLFNVLFNTREKCSNKNVFQMEPMTLESPVSSPSSPSPYLPGYLMGDPLPQPVTPAKTPRHISFIPGPATPNDSVSRYVDPTWSRFWPWDFAWLLAIVYLKLQYIHTIILWVRLYVTDTNYYSG